MSKCSAYQASRSPAFSPFGYQCLDSASSAHEHVPIRIRPSDISNGIFTELRYKKAQ